MQTKLENHSWLCGGVYRFPIVQLKIGCDIACDSYLSRHWPQVSSVGTIHSFATMHDAVDAKSAQIIFFGDLYE